MTSINIEVMFFGRLRELVGISREKATLEAGDKLSDLIAGLSEKHGAGFAEKLKGMEDLRILVNGREYQVLNGFETRLKDKDTVVLLPLIEGG